MCRAMVRDRQLYNLNVSFYIYETHSHAYYACTYQSMDVVMWLMACQSIGPRDMNLGMHTNFHSSSSLGYARSPRGVGSQNPKN